jgi:hypothetical protein
MHGPPGVTGGVTHEPLMQRFPPVHAFPHVPQFCASIIVSVQVPLQRI